MTSFADSSFQPPPEAEAFYIEEETIVLCPDSCESVQGDAMAKLDVRYGCDVGYVE